MAKAGISINMTNLSSRWIADTDLSDPAYAVEASRLLVWPAYIAKRGDHTSKTNVHHMQGMHHKCYQQVAAASAEWHWYWSWERTGGKRPPPPIKSLKYVLHPSANYYKMLACQT